jgi:hypothetical protein
MTGNKNTNHIQKFNHKLSTALSVPYFLHSKKQKRGNKWKRKLTESCIFTYTRQDVKLHSYVQQLRHSRTMSQTLLCEALNAKSSCFTSICPYTRTKLLTSPTIVFDDGGQPLVSLSMISNDHLQSHCTISMPVCDVDGQPLLFLFIY